jgi:hypothetical protein
VAAFFLDNPMLFVLALFVCFAGQQELMALRRREALRQAGTAAVVLPVADESAAPAPSPMGFSGFIWDRDSRVWVMWHNGHPVAYYGGRAE